MNSRPPVSALLKICRTPPICVLPSVSVRDATRVMVENGVGAVAVVENDVLVGILTERDLMVKVTDTGADASQVLVSDVMATNVRTVAPDKKHEHAASEMLKHHCRHLPVTDSDGKILGMLSIRHLYREQLRRLQGQMDSLESYITADGPGG
jgi:CBS domain-containing protein